MIAGLQDAEVLGRSEEREVLVLAEQPGLSVTWSRFAAGRRGAEPHVHHEHIDCFYVLAGELTVTVGPASTGRRSARAASSPPRPT